MPTRVPLLSHPAETELFGDALTPVSIAGIGFIIAGVLVVELGSHA